MENSKGNSKSESSAGKAVANVVTPQNESTSEMRMPEAAISQSRDFDKVSEDRQTLTPFAKTQKSGNLPDHIQAKMEHSFGQDFSDVEVVRNSDKAKSLEAIAFTQGNIIHVAPGYDPFSFAGQELLGHELTHVVQQQQGRVTPTHYEAGMGVNDSVELESEANKHGVMASKGELITTRPKVPFARQAIQKRSAVVQMWRPLPGQARTESTAPDVEGAWRAVVSAIRQVAGGFAGGVIPELRTALIGRISEELAGGLGTITINNFKTFNGPNMTWRGDIQFPIDGIREIGGGGVGTTALGAGGSTTTGSSTTDTQTGGTTGGGTISSSPGSAGGTGGSLSAGVSSGSTNAQGSSASHVRNATTSSSVTQVLKRYSASMACFVNLSAETSFGDSGWDYVNPAAWSSGLGTGFVGAIGELTGSASSNCGTIIYYEGSGISTP